MNSLITPHGKLNLPAFFPDATRGVVRSADSEDILKTATQGVLVNTLHILHELGSEVLESYGGIHKFMNWDKSIISDSGGFQIYSLSKSKGIKNSVTDEGVTFHLDGKKHMLTPERSIEYQFLIGSDIMVVLDDFTAPGDSYSEAKATVKRTIEWAKRSKSAFEKMLKKKKVRPLLIAVSQGGSYKDLRTKCTKELVDIGFDGIGFGGWPMTPENTFDTESAWIIANNTPQEYIRYGLGIGKPHDIVTSVGLGYTLFDCVLPTRDGRHGRLYVFNEEKYEKKDFTGDFCFYYSLPKGKVKGVTEPVSRVCDCHTCNNYSLGYLNHLFSIKDTLAYRLATIHNLRFYAMLMESAQSFSTQSTEPQE